MLQFHRLYRVSYFILHEKEKYLFVLVIDKTHQYIFTRQKLWLFKFVNAN